MGHQSGCRPIGTVRSRYLTYVDAMASPRFWRCIPRCILLRGSMKGVSSSIEQLADERGPDQVMVGGKEKQKRDAQKQGDLNQSGDIPSVQRNLDG